MGTIVLKKPTYDELEQRVKELERNESARKRAEKIMLESEEKFRNIVEISLSSNPTSLYTSIGNSRRFLDTPSRNV